jgi:hypothetical protein
VGGEALDASKETGNIKRRESSREGNHQEKGIIKRNCEIGYTDKQ